MSEPQPAAAPPASSDPTIGSTSSSPPTDTASAPSTSSASASTAASASASSSSSSSVTLPSGVNLIPAERNEFYVGAPIYVRQQPATVTLVDWPHVYWHSTDMADEQQKHRSFNDQRDIFSIDERDRGKKVERRDAPLHSAHTHSALPGLLLSTQGGGGLVDEEDEDDDDDDDDEEFTVAAVTAVLKPSLAQKAIAVMEERRSPKHSPKNSRTGTPPSEDSGGGSQQTEGKSEEQGQLVDSDS